MLKPPSCACRRIKVGRTRLPTLRLSPISIHRGQAQPTKPNRAFRTPNLPDSGVDRFLMKEGRDEKRKGGAARPLRPRYERQDRQGQVGEALRSRNPRALDDILRDHVTVLPITSG